MSSNFSFAKNENEPKVITLRAYPQASRLDMLRVCEVILVLGFYLNIAVSYFLCLFVCHSWARKLVRAACFF